MEDYNNLIFFRIVLDNSNATTGITCMRLAHDKQNCEKKNRYCLKRTVSIGLYFTLVIVVFYVCQQGNKVILSM